MARAHLSMRAEVAALGVVADEAKLARLRPVLADVQAAGRVDRVDVTSGGDAEPRYDVRLA